MEWKFDECDDSGPGSGGRIRQADGRPDDERLRPERTVFQTTSLLPAPTNTPLRISIKTLLPDC